MNERIQQLIEQATLTINVGGMYQYFDKEKFAELIVAECASKVTRNEALNILEHFGVEE